MGKILSISAILSLLLVSCGGQGAITTSPLPTLADPTAVATATPTLISQNTQLLIPTLGEISTPTLISGAEQPPTATLTPFPAYPNKKVIFEYYTLGNQSYFDPFFKQGFRELPTLVLYEDGLMILVHDSYMQKVLSQDEIQQLLSKLKELGFYSLESNQKHDRTDKLYNYPDIYQGTVDGSKECISVKADQERTLCAYEPDMQYLVPGMKRILAYLDGYKPTGLTPYYPDRILLYIQEHRGRYLEPFPGTAVPWGSDLPALNTLPCCNSSPYLGVPPDEMSYFEGAKAKALYLFFERSSNADSVFEQDGEEYIVYIAVVLPHEELTNAYP